MIKQGKHAPTGRVVVLTLAVLLGIASGAMTLGALIRQKQDPSAKGRTADWHERMNAKEKAHARAHGRFKTTTHILDEERSVHLSAFGASMPEPSPGVTELDSVKKLKCESDAVFVGIVRSAKSMPTEDGTFLFTDYTIEIDESFRTPSNKPLLQEDVVTVTRPGGAMMIGNKEVSATISDRPFLEVGGKYLIFGSLLPGSGAFLVERPDAVYQMIRDQFVDLRDRESSRTQKELRLGRPSVTNALLSKVCR